MNMNDEQQGREMIKVNEPTSSDQMNSSEVTPPDNDLAGAFRDLGQNILDLFRAVGENERVRKFQQDVATGFQTVAEQVQHGYENLTQTDVAKNVQEQASKATEHPVAQNIGGGLSELVSNLSSGINRLADQIRTSGSESSSATASSPSDNSDIVEPVEISTNDAEAVEQIADMNGALNPGGKANAISSGDDLKTERMGDEPIH